MVILTAFIEKVISDTFATVRIFIRNYVSIIWSIIWIFWKFNICLLVTKHLKIIIITLYLDFELYYFKFSKKARLKYDESNKIELDNLFWGFTRYIP